MNLHQLGHYSTSQCLSPSTLSALLRMCRDALFTTKVALVELPTVITWLVSSSAHPFPGRMLAWSFAVPRSHFHPAKALKYDIYDSRVIIDRPTPATQIGLENMIRG